MNIIKKFINGEPLPKAVHYIFALSWAALTFYATYWCLINLCPTKLWGVMDVLTCYFLSGFVTWPFAVALLYYQIVHHGFSPSKRFDFYEVHDWTSIEGEKNGEYDHFWYDE